MNIAIIYMECVSRESATVLECMLETVFPVEVMRTNEKKNGLLFNFLNNGILLLVHGWLYMPGPQMIPEPEIVASKLERGGGGGNELTKKFGQGI